MQVETLQAIIESHVKECDSRDKRNTEAITEIKGMFKGIWDAHDEMRGVVTSLQIKGALAIGGLIVVSKAFDYLLTFIGHKCWLPAVSTTFIPI